jgi:peptide/nickel transport system ATP-binding protein
MKKALLSVENVAVEYASNEGTVHVLDDVSISVGSGEIVGLVGESGCGKSTLARTILGVLPSGVATIRAGKVIFDDKDLLTLPKSTVTKDIRGRRITLIPQDPYAAFNPLFTIGTQIMDLMRWKAPGLSEIPTNKRQQYIHDRVMETLTSVRIPDPEGALRKLPHEFSGGQLQRIMIAMAFLPKPDLIIADEPTTALDVTIQAQILRLLRKMADEEGVSIIFTTHDLATAYQICDRVVVMYAGQEVEDALTETFFDNPRHPYTYGLLDCIPGEWKDVKGIAGDMPNLANPPRGCRFHTRCSIAEDICTVSRPPTIEFPGNHKVRCYGAAPTRGDF